MRVLFAALTCVLLSPFGAYGQTPSYRLDAQQRTVLEIWNLSPDMDCFRSELDGSVVAQEFYNRGTIVTGFTVQPPRGTRQYVNVETKPNEWDRLTTGWVMQGLEQMTARGSRVRLMVKYCGAAGRVVYLEAIRRLQ